MITNYMERELKHLFEELLKQFPKKEDIEKYYRDKDRLPKEVITIVEKVKLTYDELISMAYKVEEPLLSSEVLLQVMTTLDKYAEHRTTDPSIYVGASVGKVIDGEFAIIGMGANANTCYNEKEKGQTYREFLFGSRDKKYRPWDRIIHAEENAIVNAIENGAEGRYDTAIVTRYPCEKCAQLMVYKGIKTVYYGRKFSISEETQSIFKKAGIKVIHVKEYVGDENDTNT